jgi:ATP-dependent helicase Lhr and Lhr-like helicase
VGAAAGARRRVDDRAQHGAMFFDELAADAHLLGVELESALGELVAAGLVNADSFAGLRALVRPAAKRAAYHGKRRPRGFGPLVGSMADAGRWAVLRRVTLTAGDNDDPHADAAKPVAPPRRLPADADLLEHVANVLLRRYGVIGWQLLAREAPWLPPWRDLLRVLHRMEARGHVRGGRFVTGLSGEQFALPEAIPLLREVRRRGAVAAAAFAANDATLVCIAASDPLNLLGTVLPGEKVPAVAGNRIAFLGGLPVATLIAGRVAFRGDFDASIQAKWRSALISSG